MNKNELVKNFPFYVIGEIIEITEPVFGVGRQGNYTVQQVVIKYNVSNKYTNQLSLYVWNGFANNLKVGMTVSAQFTIENYKAKFGRYVNNLTASQFKIIK